jgi:hypothetical protein
MELHPLHLLLRLLPNPHRARFRTAPLPWLAQPPLLSSDSPSSSKAYIPKGDFTVRVDNLLTVVVQRYSRFAPRRSIDYFILFFASCVASVSEKMNAT